MNPDIWDPAVRGCYGVSLAGHAVEAVIGWGKWGIKDEFANSSGRVEHFEDASGRGLRGELDTPPSEVPKPFQRMKVTITQPAGGGKTFAVVDNTQTGVQRTLDDAFGGPYWSAGTSWIQQYWFAEGPGGEYQGEYVDIWLINVWAARHLNWTPYRYLRDLAEG
jgi:hypothetical protein